MKKGIKWALLLTMLLFVVQVSGLVDDDIDDNVALHWQSIFIIVFICLSCCIYILTWIAVGICLLIAFIQFFREDRARLSMLSTAKGIQDLLVHIVNQY